MSSKSLKKKSISKSLRSGLTFPVGRVLRNLRKGKYALRFGQGAPIFLAAVLEYLSAEILELSGNVARDCRRSRIAPRDIQLAVRCDDELSKLLQDCTFPSTGVVPKIHSALFPAKLTDKKGTSSQQPISNSSPSPKKKRVSTKGKNSVTKTKTTENATEDQAHVQHWQYFDNGWKDYNPEADRIVEEAYKDYMQTPGSYDVRAVKSGHWLYQVDFINMKQTNVQHEAHTVRDIRRV